MPRNARTIGHMSWRARIGRGPKGVQKGPKRGSRGSGRGSGIPRFLFQTPHFLFPAPDFFFTRARARIEAVWGWPFWGSRRRSGGSGGVGRRAPSSRRQGHASGPRVGPLDLIRPRRGPIGPHQTPSKPDPKPGRIRPQIHAPKAGRDVLNRGHVQYCPSTPHCPQHHHVHHPYHLSNPTPYLGSRRGSNLGPNPCLGAEHDMAPSTPP